MHTRQTTVLTTHHFQFLGLSNSNSNSSLLTSCIEHYLTCRNMLHNIVTCHPSTWVHSIPLIRFRLFEVYIRMNGPTSYKQTTHLKSHHLTYNIQHSRKRKNKKKKTIKAIQINMPTNAIISYITINLANLNKCLENLINETKKITSPAIKNTKGETI